MIGYNEKVEVDDLIRENINNSLSSTQIFYVSLTAQIYTEV